MMAVQTVQKKTGESKINRNLIFIQNPQVTSAVVKGCYDTDTHALRNSGKTIRVKTVSIEEDVDGSLRPKKPLHGRLPSL